MAGGNQAARGGFSAAQWTALLFVVCCGFSSQMVMPLWVGAVIESHGLDEAAVGRVGSLEYAAVAVVSLIVAFGVQRLRAWPTVLIGLLLLIAGNALSAFASTEGGLATVRMLCGVGKGLVVAVTFGLVAGTPRPVAAFAMVNLVYAVFSTLFYLGMPHLIRPFGATGAFLGMAAVAVLGGLFMVCYPDPPLRGRAGAGAGLRSLPAFGWLALLGLVVLWSGHNVVWTYVERIGNRAGLGVEAIGGVLSLAAFMTIFGPALARLLDARLGYGPPMLVAVALKTLAVFALLYAPDPRVYAAAVPAFLFLTLFITPYVMGVLSVADPAGRLAAASSAAMTAGGSAGAFVGGLVATVSYPGLAWTAAALFAVFVVLVAWVAPTAARHRAPHPGVPPP